jgi:hypothetical protein
MVGLVFDIIFVLILLVCIDTVEKFPDASPLPIKTFRHNKLVLFSVAENFSFAEEVKLFSFERLLDLAPFDRLSLAVHLLLHLLTEVIWNDLDHKELDIVDHYATS